MIAVDTNIVARFLLHDDEGQREQATRLLASTRGQALVDDLSIAEIAWILKNRAKANPATIAKAVEALTINEKLRVADTAIVETACTESLKHGFGIADALIGVRNRAAGCETTYTFDKRAARSELFTLVPD